MNVLPVTKSVRIMTVPRQVLHLKQMLKQMLR